MISITLKHLLMTFLLPCCFCQSLDLFLLFFILNDSNLKCFSLSLATRIIHLIFLI